MTVQVPHSSEMSPWESVENVDEAVRPVISEVYLYMSRRRTGEICPPKDLWRE